MNVRRLALLVLGALLIAGVAPTVSTVSAQAIPTRTLTRRQYLPAVFAARVSAPTGRVYYVATNGSDSNAGTLAAPWRTIGRATRSLVAGETIYIRAGTYNERVNLSYMANSAGPYITFAAYPGEAVILDGTGIDIAYGGGLFHIWETDYIRVVGLRVQHSNGAGIYVGYSNNIKVENAVTYDTVKSGIGIWDSTNVVVDGNDIALACNPHPNYTQSEEFITIDASTNVEVGNNHVHDSPAGLNRARAGGEGIGIKNGSGYITVQHNLVYNLDKLAIGLDAWDNSASTHDVDFTANVVHDCYYGLTVASEQGGTVENVKVNNNIAYNITWAGFAIPWWSGTKDGLKRNLQFINNTSYHNGYGLWIQSPLNENVVVRNNIFSQNGTQITVVSGAAAQTTLDHNLLSDPLFVNAAAADFHVQAGSPAIDTGSVAAAPAADFDGKPRPQGAGDDIGAYER